jgi:hypothetical protein
VLRDVTECRTAALGGHLDECSDCAWQRPSYNSCRNRHCPICQAGRRRDWTEQREARHLPVPHYQVVFTLPAELRELARANPRLLYDLHFDAGQTVLQGLASELHGVRLAIFGVLHTWTREMFFHPHVHFVVSAGGLSLDGGRWVALPTDFLFPIARMAAWFRTIVLDKLKRASLVGKLDTGGRSFASVRRGLGGKRWVVNVEPPEDRAPEQAIRYLARYVYGVAISDARIVSADGATVTISTRGGRTVTLTGEEFVRRFALHVLPSGFRKVRYYGLLAPGMPGELERARALCASVSPAAPREERAAKAEKASFPPEEPRRCPCCGGAVVRTALPGGARAPPWWF